MNEPVTARRWVESPTHRLWLQSHMTGLLRFSQQSVARDGGFFYLDANGDPMPGRQPALFLAARMTHAAAVGSALGVPGSTRLLAHGVESLRGPFADPVNGGWNSTTDSATDKAAYEHVHVLLAASSAVAAGYDDARVLLAEAVEVFEDRLWSEDEGAIAESWTPDWSVSEPYRGANANMHGVEAMLAAGDVTGEPVWHERALRVASRIINQHARDHGWTIPEHFDDRWQVLPAYNRDEPNHPFRPYGITYGHSLEWARFLVGLHTSSMLPDESWLLEAAIGLTETALASWGSDGREGLVYTADWDGTPISRLRLHWPICEAIQTCAVLSDVTGEDRWETWYRRAWDYASRYFVEDTGAWINERDAEGNIGESVWPGRPDVYHSIGAYVVPLLPTSPFMTAAAAAGLLKG